eukprot:g3969.t1
MQNQSRQGAPPESSYAPPPQKQGAARPPSETSSTLSDCTRAYRLARPPPKKTGEPGRPSTTQPRRGILKRPRHQLRPSTTQAPNNAGRPKSRLFGSPRAQPTRIISAKTRKLFNDFQAYRRRHISHQNMTYQIDPLGQGKRETQLEKNGGWNTRFRPHDITIEEKKKQDTTRPWTSSMALQSRRRRGRAAAAPRRPGTSGMTGKQRELARFFRVENQDKYINKIPPLVPKTTKEDENPYLNFPRPALAPFIPRRPHKKTARKVHPQLNPYYGKQKLWPEKEKFDLKQYTLLYKASKENVRATDTTWLAYWTLRDGKHISNVKLVGSPFAYDPNNAWGGKVTGAKPQAYRRVKFYRNVGGSKTATDNMVPEDNVVTDASKNTVIVP